MRLKKFVVELVCERSISNYEQKSVSLMKAEKLFTTSNDQKI